MTTVMAVLSFAMAFGAIWFTSEALKRVDSYNDARLRPHIKKINQTVAAVHETLNGLKNRLETLERQVRILNLNAELPPAIEQDVTALRKNLTAARRRTPPVRLTG